MVALNPPGSTAVVEVADEVAENYKAQGWSVVKAEPKAQSKSDKPAKPAGK